MKIQPISNYKISKTNFQKKNIGNPVNRIITKHDPVKDMDRKFVIAAIALLLIESIGTAALYKNTKNKEYEEQNKTVVVSDADSPKSTSVEFLY